MSMLPLPRPLRGRGERTAALARARPARRYPCAMIDQAQPLPTAADVDAKLRVCSPASRCARL